MKSVTPFDESNGSTLHVDGRPVTLNLPVGSAIFAVHGEVWLTQEGLLDDIVVGPGGRFVVRAPGAIVASATRDAAHLFVVTPQTARLDPARDVHDFARGVAEQLRSVEIARFIERAVAALRSLGARPPAAPVLRRVTY